MEFHHIGIATNNIDETVNKYNILGYTISSEIYHDVIQNVFITFMEKSNSPRLELVAPVDQFSPILNTLKKNGTIPYHICYEVTDIKLEVERLKKLKFVIVSKIVPAIAFENRLVCFLYSKETGLIELLNK
jgi:methylmalonyl-CoA/ethylmalonyl-CoA epimerase